MRDDDDWRHECEVRQVLLWRQRHGRDWVRDWMQRVERSRGPDAAKRLQLSCAEQWKRGNRGERWDWR